MVAAPIHHISLDEQGVAYVNGTSLKVSHLAIDAETWGMTPQRIQENYPRLSLAQIHAALAYYHDHRSEVDEQSAQDTEEYERLRAKTPQSAQPRAT